MLVLEFLRPLARREDGQRVSSVMQRQPPAIPRVTAEVVFLTHEEGGRRTPPNFTRPHQYMPHVVVQPREVRRALVNEQGVGTELYEGIAFVTRPEGYRVGSSGVFVFDLMYYPQDLYPAVQPGATFTVREGLKIVAHGIVTARANPAAA
jgi:translation elongation factor EF-Tu-like GTPase